MTATDNDLTRTDLLGTALVEAVQRTGASVGGLYLRPDDEPVLRLAVLCGLPPELFAPWTRVALAAPLPVSDAVRDDRLVWVGSQEDLVRLYPRTAVALPYRFALAAVPLHGRFRCWGSLLLMWPSSHPARLTDRQRGAIMAGGRRVARQLDESLAWPGAEPAAHGA